jgi:phage-related protein
MASATYKINGKFDSKPISKAEAAMKKLSTVATGLKTAFVGIAAVKIGELFSKIKDGAEDAFKAQNKALVNFRQSAANNLNLTSKDIDALNSKMAELSTNNFFDGDSLNNSAAYLSNLKLSRKQIEETLDAATELAAAGIMPLDQATKSLAKTYSGELEGALKDIAPELANLTAEQISNGIAVDALKKKYSGFRDTMSETFSGRDKQFQNTFGDLQASLGGISSSLKFEAQGAIMPQLQQITDWITQNRNYIINFFLHLPEVAKLSFSTLGDYMFNFIKPDNMITLVKDIINIWVTGWQNVITLVPDIIKTMFESLVEIGKMYGSKLGLAMVQSFGKMFADGINKVLEGFKDSGFGRALGWVYEKLSGNSSDTLFNVIDISLRGLSTALQDSTAAERALERNQEKAQKEIKNKLDSTMTKLKDAFKGDFDARKKMAGDIGKMNEDTNKEFLKNLKNLLGQDLPEDLKKALEAQVVANPTAPQIFLPSATTSGTTSGTTGENSKDPGTLDYIAQVTSGLSSLGSTMKFINDVIQAILSGNWLTFIIGLIVQLLQAVMENSDTVKAFFDGFSSMIGVFAKKIAPMLAQILEPLLGLFESLGVVLDVVALIVKALTPILTLLAKAINAVFKAVAYVIGGIVNGIIGIIRGVIRVINKLPGVHISKPDYIDLTGSDYTIDTSASSSTASATSSTASASASYTAARDIYMNVYYQNSYVNGDARAIALSIREEIRRAEQLGY